MSQVVFLQDLGIPEAGNDHTGFIRMSANMLDYFAIVNEMVVFQVI